MSILSSAAIKTHTYNFEPQISTFGWETTYQPHGRYFECIFFGKTMWLENLPNYLYNEFQVLWVYGRKLKLFSVLHTEIYVVEILS